MANDVPAPGYYEFLVFNAPALWCSGGLIAAALARARPCSSSGHRMWMGGTPPSDPDRECWDAKVSASTRTERCWSARGGNGASKGPRSSELHLVEGVAPTEADPVDLVMCVGSDHASGDQRQALRALHRLTKPGGRVLFGTTFWETSPTRKQARATEMELEALSDLDGLVDLAVNTGFRPLWTQTASRDEWETFESGYLADWEEWLHRYGDHPAASDIRQKADTHRKGWLAGYRDVLGFAYLTLGR